MPILLLILILVVLVAQIGFWDTFVSVLGAIGVLILLLVLIAGALALFVWMLYRRYF